MGNKLEDNYTQRAKETCRWLKDDKCGFYMPDSEYTCYGMEDCGIYREEQKAMNKKVIDGVGQDAEIVVNEKGGKQSKSPMAMHLVDPKFLAAFAKNGADEVEYIDSDDCATVDAEDKLKYDCCRAIEWIASFMQVGGTEYLRYAADCLEENDIQQMIRIAKVLQFGADKYKANNWRLIPQEEHINHALIHLMAALAGDTQDDHIDHAMCRLMMAYATEKSDNFEYGAYVA